jgi:hypothetical protein
MMIKSLSDSLMGLLLGKRSATPTIAEIESVWIVLREPEFREGESVPIEFESW